MQSLGIWFSGGTDSVRLMVGPDDLQGLLQSKWFYDSMILQNINSNRACLITENLRLWNRNASLLGRELLASALHSKDIATTAG